MKTWPPASLALRAFALGTSLLAAAAAAAAAAAWSTAGCELLSLDSLQDEPADGGGGAHGEAGGEAGGEPAAGPSYFVYYTFDEGTSDSSGNGFAGTLAGSAAVNVPGVKGNALACHGGMDALTFPAAAFQPGTASFTIAFFYQLTLTKDGGTAESQNTLFWKGSAWDNSLDTTTGVALGYWSFQPLYLNAVANDGVSGDADFTLSGYLPPPTSPIADGKFHHAALVVDRQQDELSVYSDGAFENAAALQGSHPFGSLDTTDLGQLCSESDHLFPLAGAIDEFMIVRGALAAADIAALAAMSHP